MYQNSTVIKKSKVHFIKFVCQENFQNLFSKNVTQAWVSWFFMLKVKMPFNRTYSKTSPQKGVGLTWNGDFERIWRVYRLKKIYGLEVSVEEFGFLGIFWPVDYLKFFEIQKTLDVGSREYPEICQNWHMVICLNIELIMKHGFVWSLN